MHFQNLLFTYVSIFFLSSPLFAQDKPLELYSNSQNTANIVFESNPLGLYLNSGNEIKIIQPLTNDKQRINYTCNGGLVMKHIDKLGVIVVTPKREEITLKMYNDTILIGIKTLRARLLPKPNIRVYADSNLVDSISQKKVSISKNTTWLTIKAEPDELFQVNYPRDTRYTIKSWSILLKKNDETIESLYFETESGNIKKLLARASVGDVILIEVNKVIRKNFMNEIENVNMGNEAKEIQVR